VFDHHPSKINALLRDGELLLAPSSTINLVNDPSLEMALPLGVCAKAEVLSVLIESDQDLSQLKSEWSKGLLKSPVSSKIEVNKAPILPSASSETSNMLAKLLWNAAFGHDRSIESSFNERDIQELNLRVIIGDDALICQKNPQCCIDLGSLWRQWTGLPFVYAVWQSKRSSSRGSQRHQEFLKKVGADLDWAADHAKDVMKQDPELLVWAFEKKFSKALAIGPELLSNYWSKIYYRIGKEDQKAVELFLELARAQIQP
jgi:chorismate dehydratase